MISLNVHWQNLLCTSAHKITKVENNNNYHSTVPPTPYYVERPSIIYPICNINNNNLLVDRRAVASASIGSREAREADLIIQSSQLNNTHHLL